MSGGQEIIAMLYITLDHNICRGYKDTRKRCGGSDVNSNCGLAERGYVGGDASVSCGHRVRRCGDSDGG
jgi:hypothetical protein